MERRMLLKGPLFFTLITLFTLHLFADIHTSVLKKTGAACLTVSNEDLNIIPATCNGADGAVRNIKVLNAIGAVSFTWKDADGKIVGTNEDLVNIAAGIYTVTVSDESKCKAFTSAGYTVPVKNQVSFNDATVKIINATCNQSNGSITNVEALNAISYAWFDLINNKQIATSPDLKGIAAGAYKLVATNKDGCSSEKTYLVGGGGLAPKITRVDTNNINCGDKVYFDFTFNVTAKDPTYRYFVLDNANNQLGDGTIIYNPDTVTFRRVFVKPEQKISIIIRDPSGCQTNIGSYTMPASKLEIDDSRVFVRNDVCGSHTGAIVNLHMKNVPPAKPLRQKVVWRDGSGKIIQEQLLPLTSIGAGTYTVTVLDPNGCSDTKTYTITDSSSAISAPLGGDIKLCLPQTFTIPVRTTGEVTGYRLYDADSAFIKESKEPKFVQKISETSVFYISALNSTCESAKTKITISVALPGIYIPNTFTPNNDGINDRWDITGLDEYPGTEIFLYNRYGIMVYHSLGTGRPFDGNVNGKQLATGVYYYIIDPKKPECKGKITGALTITR